MLRVKQDTDFKVANPSFGFGTLASVCRPVSFSLLDKELNWPETMPWISFSERLVGSMYFSLFNCSASTDAQSSTKAGGIVITNLTKALPELVQITPSHSGSDANTVQLASRLANIIPQYFPGQHLLNSQTVSLGASSNAIQAVLQWAIYQMSNGKNFSDEIIVQLFDRCGIQNTPLYPGDKLFSESTFKVIRDKFWGAGLRTKRRDIIIWGIKSGIGPNTRVQKRFYQFVSTTHLPLVVLCCDDYHEKLEPSIDSNLAELLLAHEVQRPSSQYCCKDHGTLLQYAAALGGLSILRVVIQRELEFTEHDTFSNSDMLQLIWSVRASRPEVAEQKFRYLLQIYEQAYYASINSQLTLMSPSNLLEALASPAKLIQASESGNVSLLRTLNLYHGLDLNCHNERMMFPLAASVISHRSWGISREQTNTRFRSLVNMGALANYAPVDESGAKYFSALHYAVFYNFYDECQLLLEHGAGLNLPAIHYSHRYDTQAIPVTPLQLSLSRRAYRCAEILLENGASIVGDEILRLVLNWRPPCPIKVTENLIMRLKSMGINIDLEEATDGRTALQIAIQGDYEALALALIRAGSSLSTLSPPLLGWYAGLHSIKDYTRGIISVRDCHMQIGEASNSNQVLAAKLWNRLFIHIEEEIGNNTDELEHLNSYNEALRFAVDKAPHESSVAALNALASGACSGNESLRVICLDLIKGFLARMQLQTYPDPHNDLTKTEVIFNLLHKAIGCYHFDKHGLLETLLAQIEPAIVPYSHRMLACYDLFFHVFEILERDYFDGILSDSSMHIHMKQLIERLLHAGFRPTTLAGLSCARLGTLQELKMLVNSGFNPKYRYPWSDTALQIASARGAPEIIKYLLTLEVDVNSSPPWMCYKESFNPDRHAYVPPFSMWNFTRRNALQSAVASGNQECIKLLLDAGADVNAKPSYWGGATALQLAAILGHVGIANWLISDYGADVNAAGAKMHGRTALEGAAEYGRLDMIHLLQHYGCTVTGSGRRQLINGIRLSAENGHTTVTEILKTWGGWTKEDEPNLEWGEEDEEYLRDEDFIDEDFIDYEDWIYIFPEEEWNQTDDGECCDNADCNCCYYNKCGPQQ